MLARLKTAIKRVSLDVPCSSAQQSLDHDTVDNIAPEFLNKGWLVEDDTSRHDFVDDSLTLVEHLGAEPAR